VFAVIAASIPAALRHQAETQPDAPAFTFIDYEVDPAGFTETLTWSEVYRQVRVVAAEIESHGSPGDRVAIIAPQGLEYIVGFLAALESGRVAVPLSVPMAGVHDERVSAVVRDCSPATILTTSAVVSDIVSYAGAEPGRSAAAVVEIDALDLDSEPLRAVTPVVHTGMALLQYTSGSTRLPAGVMVTHRNIVANLEQVFADYFEDFGKFPPPETSPVSWLPLYHDMGLLLGIFAPVAAGLHAVLMSPIAFLQKPARWMQQLAIRTRSFSAAPNFAYELAAARTSDEDMAGLDMGGVLCLISGSERIHAATVERFNQRFGTFHLPDSALRPSYGLAEATLYVASTPPGHPAQAVRFDPEKLSAGHARRCEGEEGIPIVGIGAPRATTLRIVDSETRVEQPAGKIGEIWIHGENVAAGYWRNQEATGHTFGGRLVDPSTDTPIGPWLRTGDLGVMSDGELFIVGRIKDLLIVDGRNHYPDDIEATIQEITGGRAAAISVPDDQGERLVAIAEVRSRGASEEEILTKLSSVKREVSSAVSRTHSVRVTDLVLVPRGSLPITTSGKVRRVECAERYKQDQFARLDAAV
jgi:long chain fatty acid CoA FadD26